MSSAAREFCLSRVRRRLRDVVCDADVLVPYICGVLLDVSLSDGDAAATLGALLESSDSVEAGDAHVAALTASLIACRRAPAAGDEAGERDACEDEGAADGQAAAAAAAAAARAGAGVAPASVPALALRLGPPGLPEPGVVTVRAATAVAPQTPSPELRPVARLGGAVPAAAEPTGVPVAAALGGLFLNSGWDAAAAAGPGWDAAAAAGPGWGAPSGGGAFAGDMDGAGGGSYGYGGDGGSGEGEGVWSGEGEGEGAWGGPGEHGDWGEGSGYGYEEDNGGEDNDEDNGDGYDDRLAAEMADAVVGGAELAVVSPAPPPPPSRGAAAITFAFAPPPPAAAPPPLAAPAAPGGAPVCRHFLTGACRRSDCAFSHAVAATPCMCVSARDTAMHFPNGPPIRQLQNAICHVAACVRICISVMGRPFDVCAPRGASCDEPCRYFARGCCARGAECVFSHAPPGGAVAGVAPPAPRAPAPRAPSPPPTPVDPRAPMDLAARLRLKAVMDECAPPPRPRMVAGGVGVCVCVCVCAGGGVNGASHFPGAGGGEGAAARARSSVVGAPSPCLAT